MNSIRKQFINRAIDIALNGMENNEGGPFGCVIVKKNEIVGEGNNRVTSSNDPTAHAEMIAIRNACKHLGTFQLDGCDIYTTCEPCPMCLGAIYWARPQRVFYAGRRNDAANAGFDDNFIYRELGKNVDNRSIPMISMGRELALDLFERWNRKEDKIEY